MADHPRECGANSRSPVFIGRVSGSSPRVRGKLCLLFSLGIAVRIIPASAGQTEEGPQAHRRWSDHPRECGANTTLLPRLLIVFGSSPRVRGKHTALARSRTCPRIIPASAGQTRRPQAQRKRRTDHPRECGANALTTADGKNRRGSSPRVRGKRVVSRAHGCVPRIIPASAGQTVASSIAMASAPDHPRECGANREGVYDAFSIGGSSPRVRGKPCPVR